VTKGLRGKTLQYLEESMAHWVMSRDVLVFMIPRSAIRAAASEQHPAARLRKHPRWLWLAARWRRTFAAILYEAATVPSARRRVRDMYELELLHDSSSRAAVSVCAAVVSCQRCVRRDALSGHCNRSPNSRRACDEPIRSAPSPDPFPDGSTLVNMFPGHREALVNSNPS